MASPGRVGQPGRSECWRIFPIKITIKISIDNEKGFVSTYIDDIVRCVEVIQIDKYTENDVLCLIKELKDQPEKYIQALAIPDVSHGSWGVKPCK